MAEAELLVACQVLLFLDCGAEYLAAVFVVAADEAGGRLAG